MNNRKKEGMKERKRTEEKRKKERKKKKERKRNRDKKRKKKFKNDFFHCRKIWACDLQVSNQQASH